MMPELQTIKARPADELVSFTAPASLEADQYRGLRHLIERLRRDSAHNVFAVTSAGAGDGKTVTTLNLAGSLAQSPDARVLVIDADLHRPCVGEYLGIDRSHTPGLVDAIVRDDCSVDQAARRIEGLNLSVLLAGTLQAGAYELLNSPRLEALLQKARARFDYVLVDTPPLLPLPDCRLIGRFVDGFLLVIAAHRTPRKAVAEALNLLDPSKLIGTVFNGDDRPLMRYASYYAYYQSPEAMSPSNGHAQWWRRAFADKKTRSQSDRAR
jgi:capsular exopolysaccharide synthesis family protein